MSYRCLYYIIICLRKAFFLCLLYLTLINRPIIKALWIWCHGRFQARLCFMRPCPNKLKRNKGIYANKVYSKPKEVKEIIKLQDGHVVAHPCNSSTCKAKAAALHELNTLATDRDCLKQQHKAARWVIG